jgi:predicted nucleic acid-binding protein
VIYLDANVVIRLVEGVPATRTPIEARLSSTLGVPNSLITSRLARLECRTKPLKIGDMDTLQLFETFFNGIEVYITELTSAVVEKATDLRAKFSFKTPDALHLASAIQFGATVFLTGDKELARCTEVPVEVL